jgi:hypothetical protein
MSRCLFKTQSFGDLILSPEIGTSSVDWAQLTRLLPEEGDRIVRNVVL